MEQEKSDIGLLFWKGLEGTLEKEEEVKHLGGGVYVMISSKYPTVDIRHFWKPKGSDKPVATKRGIALNKYKWERLCVAMQVMRDFVPELEEACICRFSHPNELELLACKECSPFEEEKLDESPNQEGNFELMNIDVVSR